MNLGLALDGKRLLICAHNGAGSPPGYHEFEIDPDRFDREQKGGYLWDTLPDQAGDLYLNASKIALAIPASSCFVKRIEIEKKMEESIPDFLKWRADLELPGDISGYIYGFIPIRRSFDGQRTESFFFAVPESKAGPLIHGFFGPDDKERMVVLPEHVGFGKVIEKSLGKDDIPQAALVHCPPDGAVAVFVKDSRLYHGRYFPLDPARADELSIDIETYLLSLVDPTESTPMILTHSSPDFITDWSPIVPVFMNIQDLDFISAWGAAEYIALGGKCVLSAGA